VAIKLFNKRGKEIYPLLYISAIAFILQFVQDMVKYTVG
jgi:hypothetical protein